MTRPSPTIPLSRTTKHVMDAQGQWKTTEMHVWRDASGWHEIPALINQREGVDLSRDSRKDTRK